MKSSLLNGALPDRRRPCTTSMADLVVGFTVIFCMICWSYLDLVFDNYRCLVLPFGICKKDEKTPNILMICLLLILGKITSKSDVRE